MAEQVSHTLVALYYAANTDSGIPTDDVSTPPELMHEYTRHVDTSHDPIQWELSRRCTETTKRLRVLTE